MDPSDRYPDEHQKRMFFLLMSHPIAQKIHKNSLTTSRVIGKISKIPYRIALVKIPFKIPYIRLVIRNARSPPKSNQLLESHKSHPSKNLLHNRQLF